MISGFEGIDLVRAFLVIGFALVFVWLWRTRTRHEPPTTFGRNKKPRQPRPQAPPPPPKPQGPPAEEVRKGGNYGWPHLPRGRR